MNKHDSDFLKKFSMVIAFLVALTIILILLGRHINTLVPRDPSPQALAQTEARIAPIGAVYVGAEGKLLALAADQARAAAASSQAAYGGTLDGKKIYESLCTGCHTAGTAGAPMLNAAGIGARVAAQGRDTLLKMAIDGFTGSTGVMPARGGNPALTDEQMAHVVDWMIDESK
ncbi:MAG: c-type cytochrome [Pseudomonadota bacterium]|nr:c-type cytochrome [Pseudomonadota bacterium]